MEALFGGRAINLGNVGPRWGEEAPGEHTVPGGFPCSLDMKGELFRQPFLDEMVSGRQALPALKKVTVLVTFLSL